MKAARALRWTRPSASGVAGILDTFDRTNSALSLGTTSDGKAAWSALVGTWGISSNQAYESGGLAGAKLAVIDGGSANATLQVSVATSEGGTGVVFRVADGSNFYLWNFSNGSLYDVTGGSFTLVASVGTPTSGQVVKVVCAGTTASFYINGALQAGGVSIPNRATATKFGIYNGSGAGTHNTRFDNFSLT